MSYLRVRLILFKELNGVRRELNGVKGHYLQVHANPHR